MTSNIKRWVENILYKRVRMSHGEILNNQIQKGAEKYENPLPGNWTAKQLIRHGKEENVDQFVYYEALEIVVEQMELTISDLNIRLFEALERADKAEKIRDELLVTAERNIRKTFNMGR